MAEQLTGLEFCAELGRGSMGQVMLARRLPEGRLVAVKRLGDSTYLGKLQQARLQREARALSRLDHPNVVRLLDLLHVGHEILLVLEYIDGTSLAEFQSKGTVRRADAVAIVSQVQAGLQHAHSLGVVHRDVKPGNVLLARDGRCTLADFGLARLDGIASGGGRTILTRPGTPVGTAPYMSPEAAMGAPDLDARSDIYSLAVVTYELLLGRLPFPAEMGTLGLLRAHMDHPVPRPGALSPGFPAGVEDALLAALAKDRDRRTARVSDFWEELCAAATRAWPGWSEEAHLAALAGIGDPDGLASCPGPKEPEQGGDEAVWPWAVLDVAQIEPTFPDLGRPRHWPSQLRWALLAIGIALATVLLVRAFLH